MKKVFDTQEIVDMWNAGYSAERIVETLSIRLSVRQVYRIGAANGDRKRRLLAKFELENAD